MTNNIPTRELKVFYCYAHEDHMLRETLERYLTHLKRRYRFSTWFDRLVAPGEHWEKTVEEHLNSADLVLLLISPDFMASDYCYQKEMQQVLERHASGDTCVIPILLRPTYYEDAPFRDLHMLPTAGIPLTRWPDLDEAFQDVILGINSTLQKLLAIPATPPVGTADEQNQQNERPGQDHTKQTSTRPPSEAHDSGPVQMSTQKNNIKIASGAQIQGAIVNLGGQTAFSGDMTITLQNMQMFGKKAPEDKGRADDVSE